MEKKSSLCASGATAALLSPTPVPAPPAHFSFEADWVTGSPDNTNWNLTRVSKSFLFPTGAFRGYKTPAKLTGSHFLSPFCLPSLHSLYSLVALFVLLPARWHLNFPSPLSPLPSSPSFFSFFALAFTQNVYHVFSISRALFLARQIVQPLSCESVSVPANVGAYKYALPVDQVWTDLSCKALHLQSHTNMFVCFLAEI